MLCIHALHLDKKENSLDTLTVSMVVVNIFTLDFWETLLW